jgi:hypothetical protein
MSKVQIGTGVTYKEGILEILADNNWHSFTDICNKLVEMKIVCKAKKYYLMGSLKNRIRFMILDNDIEKKNEPNVDVYKLKTK